MASLFRVVGVIEAKANDLGRARHNRQVADAGQWLDRVLGRRIGSSLHRSQSARRGENFGHVGGKRQPGRTQIDKFIGAGGLDDADGGVAVVVVAEKAH